MELKYGKREIFLPTPVVTALSLMELFSSISEKVIDITSSAIVTIVMHVPFLLHALLNLPPVALVNTVVPATTTSSVSSSAPSTEKPVQRSRPPVVISTSTAEIGGFTVNVTCADSDPTTVQILKGGVLQQTFFVHAAVSGTVRCPAVENHDVNFDGFPDFTLLTDTGSGGGSFNYWFFSTSTQQFYCPEPYNDCTFMNPEFHPEIKTIIGTAALGAGHRVTDTYKIIDGHLVSVKEVHEDY